MTTAKIPEVEKTTTSTHINLQLTDQDGLVEHLNIPKNTPLSKVMSAYCEREIVRLVSKKFIFEGNRINDTDTPTSLGMEEGDGIDVFQEQIGGSSMGSLNH